MESHMDSAPVEDVSGQTHFAQTASDMNQILDSSANRDRARFSIPFQDKRPQPPSDEGRVFADSLPSGHPSLQHKVSQFYSNASNFEYGGQQQPSQSAVPRREPHRRDEGFFTTPAGSPIAPLSRMSLDGVETDTGLWVRGKHRIQLTLRCLNLTITLFFKCSNAFNFWNKSPWI